jgi:hypothetical protein
MPQFMLISIWLSGRFALSAVCRGRVAARPAPCSAAQIVAQRVKAAIASCPMQLVRSADLNNLRLGIADLDGMDEPLDIVERAKADAMITALSV